MSKGPILWVVALRKSRPRRYIGEGWFDGSKVIILRSGFNRYTGTFLNRRDAREALKATRERSAYFDFNVEIIPVRVKLVRVKK